MLVRNATRGYLDVAALADRLGERWAAGVVLAWTTTTRTRSTLADGSPPQVARQLARAVAAGPMYGTGALWRSWIGRLRDRQLAQRLGVAVELAPNLRARFRRLWARR